MKHGSSRGLYAYWNQRRGPRAAPERGEIEPGSIRRALGDSFILTFDPACGHPFRLAGTRVCGLFGRELRGDAFEGLWHAADRAAARDLVAIVAKDSSGIVAGVAGESAEGTIELELLLLPLRHRGDPHARQIGVLAPLASPPWLGIVPLTVLSLRTHRHIGPAFDSPIATPFVAAALGGRARRGLVIYDGGRS